MKTILVVDSPYVKRMKAITRKVANYREIVTSDNPGFQTLDAGGRAAVSRFLYESKRASVAKFYGEKGSSFPEHEHNEAEIFVLTGGHIKIDIEGKPYELKDIGVLHMAPNTPHQVTCLEDTHMLCVAVPPSEDFPHE